MLIQSIFSFLAGITLLLISANYFLKYSEIIAHKFKLSPFFISIFLVAFGATLPELTVTISSIINNDAGLGMGNAVGSSIANLTIILGVPAVFGAIKVGINKTQKLIFLLLLVTFLFSVIELSALFPIYKAGLLLFAFVATFIYQINVSKVEKKQTEKQLYKKPVYFYLVLTVASMLGLALGGKISVDAISIMAIELKISTTILGLTITSVATSLPEMLLSILATRKSDNKVVLGTLVGSNMFNLTLFPALIIFANQNLNIKKFISIKEIFTLLLVTFIFYTIVRIQKGRHIDLKLGILLISIFLIFSFISFYI